MRRVRVPTFGRRTLPVIAIVVMLCALSVTTSSSLLAQNIDTNSVGPSRGNNVFYTTSSGGPNGVELFAIDVRGNNITTRDIGAMLGGDCATLALSRSGTLYSMCGALFGEQQLATVDRKTGRA